MSLAAARGRHLAVGCRGAANRRSRRYRQRDEEQPDNQSLQSHGQQDTSPANLRQDDEIASKARVESLESAGLTGYTPGDLNNMDVLRRLRPLSPAPLIRPLVAAAALFIAAAPARANNCTSNVA